MDVDKLRRQLSLYLITDDSGRSAAELELICSAAIRGGVTAIQLREKSASRREVREIHSRLERLCTATDILYIVNAELLPFLESTPAFVHAGKRSADSISLHHDWGYSSHSSDEAVEAMTRGARFVTVSPIFETPSKPGALGSGTQLLSETRKRLQTAPIVGLGGITIENAGEVIAAGADGAAVISAIMATVEPEAAARKLRNEIDRALRR
jgi:thiamine-phosphate pyrophosphorylase